MSYAVKVTTSHIRPLDVRHDLPEVADLIELSFANHMDAEGRDYIRYIRRVANNGNLVRWIPGAAERVSMPLHGYVWVENDHVIGNLTLIPFLSNTRWFYLIANVAVHPDFRGQGIGKMLTQKALEHIQNHHVSEAWLQVRDDNPIAHNMYLNLGFTERARRSTWQATPEQEPPLSEGVMNVRVTRRFQGDWEKQSRWLSDTYPPEVSWNLAFDWRRLRPGLIRSLTSWINGETFQHWSARLGSRVLGTATWEPGRALTDIIWLGVDPEMETPAIEALLTQVRRAQPNSNYLTVNYPAGRADEAFERAGFTRLNTLIWMSMDFSGTRAT